MFSLGSSLLGTRKMVAASDRITTCFHSWGSEAVRFRMPEYAMAAEDIPISNHEIQRVPYKRLGLTVKGISRAVVPKHTALVIEGELIENTNE